MSFCGKDLPKQSRQAGQMDEKKLRKRTALHIILTIAVMGFIFIQSAMPADISSEESGWLTDIIIRLTGFDPEPVTFVVRKGAHFISYFTLGLCLCFSVKDVMLLRAGKAGTSPEAVSFRAQAVIAWVIGTAYAASDELHQKFVPGRSGELRDVAIDSCGVAAAILIVYILKRKGRRRVS